jgi:spore germination cell wall hydrolase CwlJ-like protein
MRMRKVVPSRRSDPIRRARAALAALAPWTLAGAALISFTASAGQHNRLPDQEFRRSSMIESQRLTLLPPRTSTLDTAILAARNALTTPDGDESGLQGLLPHIRKVDLSRELSAPHSPGAPLLFLTDRTVLPERRLDPAITLHYASKVLLARLNRFEGRTLAPGMASTLSHDAAAQGTASQVLTRSRPDGATPTVTRAAQLASVTPAPVEPEIIASGGMLVPAFARVHSGVEGKPVETVRLNFGPGYRDLINPEAMAQEQRCLAEAVYFEARSETEAGQEAVAQVVLNRVKSGLYPTNICGVVYQNRHRYKACQFTFACEGKKLVTNEAGPWETAQRIAKAVLEGERYNTRIGTATHYHTDYVAPRWSRKLKRNEQIGRHIFYSLRPGQT